MSSHPLANKRGAGKGGFAVLWRAGRAWPPPCLTTNAGRRNMFEATALLIVEDHFLIAGRGLVLAPLLDLPPDDRRFTQFTDEVLIRRPDGSEQRCPGYFWTEHFYRSGGKGSWHIALVLPTGTKESVPIGSGVFVSEQAHARIRGEVPKANPANTAMSLFHAKRQRRGVADGHR